MSNRYQAEDKYLTLNAMRFRYREGGTPGAPPVVLLHGMGSSANRMDPLAEGLAAAYHLFALDQRGFGHSDWAEDYHLDRRVEDLDAFVTALGLRDFALVGSSMGGIVAYLYAGRFPGKPACIVIGDVGADIADLVAAGPVATPTRTPQLFQNPEAAVAAAMSGNPRADRELHRQIIVDNLVKRPDGHWTWRNDPLLLTNSPDRQVPSAEQWAIVAQITCPTLLLRGEESTLLSRATAERMQRTIPNCRVAVLADYGHGVDMLNPNAVLSAVRPFLAEGRAEVARPAVER